MMAPSNAYRVALETEVTATLDRMAQLLGANQSENGGPQVNPEPLRQLSEQLGRVGLVAGEHGLFGLHDVCTLLQGGLFEIAAQDRPLAPGELDLLLQWPERVIDYLDAPQDADKGRALAELLSQPEWAQPIAEEEASMLAELLMSLPGNASMGDDEGCSTEPANESATEESMSQGEGLEPACDEPLAPVEAVAAVDEGASDASISTDDGLDTLAAAPPAEQEDVPGASLTTEPEPVCERTAFDDEYDADPEISAPSVSSELVALLEAEIQDIAPAFAEALAEEAAEARSSLLESLAEVMVRIAEAADAVEMPGLSHVCAHTGNNLAILAENAGSGDTAVLQAWPQMVLAYLQAPSDPERCQELVAYLQLPGWPYELDGDFADELVRGLRVELGDTAPEPAEQRQTQATDGDTSLAVPQDVSQELLESLLLELPGLTAQFSATIHRLSKGEGSLEDLTTAQRAAHTLKGAANTVGVAGIATLAHHVEDILQALAKREELPAGPLAECLIDASDCLEMMAEALLGIGEAPGEAKTVLQQILDWANWIDHNGLPTAEDSLSAAQPQLKSEHAAGAGDESGAPAAEFAQPTQSSPQKAQAASLAAPRATISQADKLLRLSGELNILHGQLTNRLDRALGDVQAWQEHGNLLQQLAIELEQMVDIRGITWTKGKGAAGDQFDPLEMDQYNELHTLSRRLMEAASDARELGQQVNSHFESMKALFIAQSRLQRDNEETVLRTRMVPAQTIVARLQRSVRQTCRVAEKQAEFLVIGADTLIDSEVLNELTDPLMHLLRNAVDHGIESAQDRTARNKPEAGAITLEFGRSGSHIMIRCRDDGAGLDFDAVRRKAEQHNLVQPGQPLSNEELSRLILRPGFSTRDASSQVSGRGIGMDAVYHGVQKLKGSLQLHSKPGGGLAVELLLPASLLSSHGVLVRAGGQRIAISSRGVEQIVPPGAGELGRLGDYMTYKIGEDVFEALHLEALLHTESPADADNPRPALLVRDSTGTVRAVLVEEVLESRTLVVKSMGEYVPKLRGIAGATILGDGSVAPVVDLEPLVREPVIKPLSNISKLADRPQSVARQQPRALVVDDSLSARRSMSQFLEDAGFEVEAALDGLDAVAAMQKALPDILMVDLEMPRMNGLELTRHVRGHSATQHLPVIMVTSRSTDKHRQEAEAAGVSAYVNKPFAEDELLRIVSELTALRGAA